MIHVKDGTEVIENLQPVAVSRDGLEHWGSSYFGPQLQQ